MFAATGHDRGAAREEARQRTNLSLLLVHALKALKKHTPVDLPRAQDGRAIFQIACGRTGTALAGRSLTEEIDGSAAQML